jgi:hypothetical protein
VETEKARECFCAGMREGEEVFEKAEKFAGFISK